VVQLRSRNWHVVVINSADWEQGKTALQDPNGPMNSWLAADLAANTKPCIWRSPGSGASTRQATGTLGLQFNMKQAANLLYAAGADS